MGYILITDSMGLASVNLTQLAPKSVGMCEKRVLAVIGSFKVTQDHRFW